MPPGERLASPLVADRAGRLAGKRDSITDPGQCGRDGKRLVDHLAAGIGQGEQVAGEIATVDRRHVRRVEMAQVACVVPVVQVPAEPLQARDGHERRLQPLHHLQRADPTEVASRHGRQQVHPDVRRRGAMRDDRSWIVLEVVWRQPMVLRTNEGLEEPPGPAGGQAEGPDVGRRKLLCGRFGGWEADQSGDNGRKQPQDDERRGDPARARLQCENEDRGCGRDGDAARHLPVEPREVEVGSGLGLRGRRPLEEVPPGGIQPRQRSQDRVAHQPGLVREEHEAEAHVGRGQGEVRAHGSKVAAFGDTLPLGAQSRHDGQRLGKNYRRHDERGPHTGRNRRERPGRNERGQRQRGGHRPAQVVDHLPAGDGGHGPPARKARSVAGPTKDPGQELPVAPRPAVLAGRRDQVVRGVFIEELNVSHQPGPGKDALEQVMAKERVLGHPVRHRGAEGVEVVDPLAGVTSLPEQVLVDVGDGE